MGVQPSIMAAHPSQVPKDLPEYYEGIPMDLLVESTYADVTGSAALARSIWYVVEHDADYYDVTGMPQLVVTAELEDSTGEIETREFKCGCGSSFTWNCYQMSSPLQDNQICPTPPQDPSVTFRPRVPTWWRAPTTDQLAVWGTSRYNLHAEAAAEMEEISGVTESVARLEHAIEISSDDPPEPQMKVCALEANRIIARNTAQRKMKLAEAAAWAYLDGKDPTSCGIESGIAKVEDHLVTLWIEEGWATWTVQFSLDSNDVPTMVPGSKTQDDLTKSPAPEGFDTPLLPVFSSPSGRHGLPF